MRLAFPFGLLFIGSFTVAGALSTNTLPRLQEEVLRFDPVAARLAVDDLAQDPSYDAPRHRAAEMKFIRAAAYFKLMQVYGKCIIRDKVDGPAENDKGFASARETWDFIEADLREAGNNIATDLPSGRLTRAAAWAYLSRVALYAEDWDVVTDIDQQGRINLSRKDALAAIAKKRAEAAQQ